MVSETNVQQLMTCQQEINFQILPEFGFIELSRESLDQATNDYMGI